MKPVYYIFALFMFCSCKESDKDRITRLVKEWKGKELIFSENSIFTRYGMDTLSDRIPDADWKIVLYIDSIGCTSCRLQFSRWKNIMYEMDSIAGQPVPFLFVFHPKSKKDLSELSYLMKRDRFDYPVWIDTEDSFNGTNKLPIERTFHSFLIDRQNKVAAVGNPFENPKIKELYLNMLCGELKQDPSDSGLTEISADQPVADLGEFDWKAPQMVNFRLINQGENPLVVNDVITSCGCISVNYPKKPILPKETLLITITYKAEKPEYINKVLTVYANTKTPLRLTVNGSAK